MRNCRAGVVSLFAVLALVSGCRVDVVTAGSAASSAPAASTTSSAAAQPGGGGAGHVPAGTLAPAAASAALAALPVAAKGSLGGYERGCGHGEGCVFGPAWADIDHNGCDQRNDVLHRDLTGVQVRPGTHDCVVVGGTLADPYTGATIPFVKADAAEVPIDHVVPLAAAWVQGAASWPAGKRAQLANDPQNLIATTREQNSAKGDSTAEEWAPPNKAYSCSYATVVITVKKRYALSVTPAEAAALRSLLHSC